MSSKTYQPEIINPYGHRDLQIPRLLQQIDLSATTGAHIKPLKTYNIIP